MTIIRQLITAVTKKYPPAKIYLVGGSIRDKLLGRPIKDFDMVIAGVPVDKLEEILNKLGTTKLVGKSFGVYKWRSRDDQRAVQIDIALPRRERAKMTGRRRDFEIQSDYNLSIGDDLSRRDFTINAIAFDLCLKKYIDPFGGRADIRAKLIKTVGLPGDRFAEDCSRMLRAMRLACQLNFKIDQKTWDAVKKNIRHIKKITAEITAAEIIKALASMPLQAVLLFNRSGLFKTLMPEMMEMKGCSQPRKWHSEGDVWKHTLMTLETLKKPCDPNLALAVLWHDLGKPKAHGIKKGKITFYGHEKIGASLAGRIIKRLKLESAGINKSAVQWLIKNHMIICSSDPKKLRSATIEKYFLSSRYPSKSLLTLIKSDIKGSKPAANNIKKNNYKKRMAILKKRLTKIKKQPQKPLLTGEEVMALMNLAPGREVGQVLRRLREAQLSGKINTKEEAEKFLICAASRSSDFRQAASYCADRLK
ncbi:MAG: HD domain-containing protein [Candidatus Jacksonbacteria bacterium]